jgi:DNA-directed RNA polymerase alpha subunit
MIRSFRETPLVIKSKDHAALVPKTLTRVKTEIELEGFSSVEANAIRRVVLNELPVKILDCEYSSVEHNDPYILIDKVISNINLVYVSQDIPENAKFSLSVKNKSPTDVLNVYVRDFKGLEKYANGGII